MEIPDHVHGNIAEAWRELAPQITARIQREGGFKVQADKLGKGVDTLRRWLKVDGSPPLFETIELLRNLGYGDMEEMFTRAILKRGNFGGDDSIMVPLYDAELAAGVGSFNEGAQILEYRPYSEIELRRLAAGRLDQLGLLRIDGDSMEKTLHDGDYVIVDMSQRAIRDGIYAFVLGGYARVKRFQTFFNGLMIKSDNDAVYETETLSMEEANELTVIGRVLHRSGFIY